ASNKHTLGMSYADGNPAHLFRILAGLVAWSRKLGRDRNRTSDDCSTPDAEEGRHRGGGSLGRCGFHLFTACLTGSGAPTADLFARSAFKPHAPWQRGG